MAHQEVYNLKKSLTNTIANFLKKNRDTSWLIPDLAKWIIESGCIPAVNAEVNEWRGQPVPSVLNTCICENVEPCELSCDNCPMDKEEFWKHHKLTVVRR